MTSRIQNFLPMIDDWIPEAFLNYHVLAPFSDEDIVKFLNKRSAELPQGKTLNVLWEEIRNSNTLDLHRTPLILTVSLGLYIHSPRYAIPQSIATFYQEVTRSLLQRHDFRTRAYLTKRNLVPVENKAQFLREFAIKMALRQNRFDEFSYKEVEDSFNAFRDRLTRLSASEKEAFLAEIIENAGLLKHLGDGIYAFAHRSFHEYFAAEHLSKNADFGVETSLHRARDPLWRQVIIFFAAMDHDRHDSLLRGLVDQNAELAGHSLAVSSKVSPDVAIAVVNKLNTEATGSNAVSGLSALSAICRSSNETVRASAIGVIGRILTEVLAPEHAKALWGLSRDDVVRLVRELAATGTRKVVETCVNLSFTIDEDARFVSPHSGCASQILSRNPRQQRPVA